MENQILWLNRKEVESLLDMKGTIKVVEGIPTARPQESTDASEAVSLFQKAQRRPENDACLS
jgi:hypothetical protein